MRSAGLARVTGAAARHAIAAAFLTPASSSVARLGQIVLEPHQVDAIARLRSAIEEFGGAILCDPVGTGKTYTALAVASACERVLVVAPAVLRTMWITASEAAGVPAVFVSHESLSRRIPRHDGFNFAIVDEAHHARNPSTRRFRALATVVSGRDVLLLTATPIHNESRDLRTLLSLFLGARAATLDTGELGRCIIRRENAFPGGAGKPVVMPLRWCDIPADDRVVKAILELPPPLPARDGGDGGALIAHSLIRQWASSDAALAGGLMRRAQRAIALINALESGTYPTRIELASWSMAAGSVQLAFAELLASPVDGSRELLEVIRAHRDGVMRVVRMIEANRARDDARAEAVRGIRAAHPGVPVVAFSQYADTVSGLFRRLASDNHVAALSGTSGQVAGGRISRAEVVARFAPEATGQARPSRADAVTLLLTTDILSEGVNLQDAGVVIHLDLPWTPAAMEQRLGRIARIGSRHSCVHAYAIHPPATAEELAGFHAILARKAQTASGIVADFPSLGGLAPVHPARNEPRNIEELRRRIGSWLAPAQSCRLPSPVTVAAVRASCRGFIAACTRNGRPLLLCSAGGGVTGDPLALLQAVGIAEGPDTMVPDELTVACVNQVRSHLEGEAALEGAGRGVSHAGHSNRRLQDRLQRAVTTASVANRHRVADLAERVRALIGVTGDAHRENHLARMTSLSTADEDWLKLLIDGSGTERPRRRAPPSHETKIIAMIVFVPDTHAIALSRATER